MGGAERPWMLAAAAAVLAIALARAQEKPDFTGVWVLETIEQPEGGRGARGPRGGPGMRGPGMRGPGMRGPGMGGPGMRRGRGAEEPPEGRPESREEDDPEAATRRPSLPGMMKPGQRLTIKQTETRLIVTEEDQTNPVMASFALDGSESANPGPAGVIVRSKTRWDGSALVTDTDEPLSTARDGSRTIKVRKVRRLEADGRTMKVELTMEMSRGLVTRTMVFKRIDD